MTIRNRIKELRRVPASTVAPSPHNWRTHPQAQSDALRGVLAEIGFAGAVLARVRDDGSLEFVNAITKPPPPRAVNNGGCNAET